MIEKYWFKTAIVTGGAGFIGSHICDELVNSGVKVTCIDNLVNGKIENIEHLMSYENFAFFNRDITIFDDIKDLFEGIDIVFNEACSKNTVSLKNPIRDLEVNIIGTYNVLEASRIAGVKKFVHASSGSVFGNPQYLPEDEEHPLNPVSFYGTSKLAGEKYCFAFSHLYGMNVTALRYFHVYGPRQDDSEFGGVVSIFIKKGIENGSPIIYGDGKQLRSFTYVQDVVNANMLVATTLDSKNEVYIVASGLKITIEDLANTVLNIMGRKELPIIYKDWRKGDIKIFDIDNRKIRALGKIDFTSFEVGLTKTINWMISEYEKRTVHI